MDPESDDEPEAYHDDLQIQPRHGSLAEGLRKLSEAETVAGHNILSYDIPALRKLRYEVSDWKTEDTLVWSKLCFSDRKEKDLRLLNAGTISKKNWGKHSLESWGERLGNPKMSYKGGFQVFTQEMLTYCIQDVDTNRTLWRYLRSLLPDWTSADGVTTAELEDHYARFCQDLEETGVHLDSAAAEKLLGGLLVRRAALDDELHRMFPPMRVKYAINKATGNQTQRADPVTGEMRDYKLVPFSPGSRQQLADRLMEKYGWLPENFSKTGDPVMSENILHGLSDVYPEAKVASERFIVQARIGILGGSDASYLRLCDSHGVLRGRINHIGTVTHRCAHSSPNLGNPTSVTKPYGKEIRAIFTRKPGNYEFAGGDASGLELRMLGHYLARWDGGAYSTVVDSGDPHTLHMDAINGGSGLRVDRNATKTLGYGWLYGAGDEKLGKTVGQGVKAGARIRKALRTKIQGMDPLLKGLEVAVKDRGYILSLDRRRVGIRKAHAALNSLLQSAGAVVMRWFVYYLRQEVEARGIIWGVDYIPHLHVHDEVQGSLRLGLRDTFTECFNAAFTRTETTLGLRVPLRCTVKFGENWYETH